MMLYVFTRVSPVLKKRCISFTIINSACNIIGIHLSCNVLSLCNYKHDKPTSIQHVSSKPNVLLLSLYM